MIGSFHQGGSERQAVQLTRLLREAENHRVFVAVLNDRGVLRGEIESLGFSEIPEFPLKSFFDLNFLRQVRLCARFIGANRIDLVQTHDFYTNIFGMAVASLARVGRIASKRETGGMRSSNQKRVEKLAFRRADAIVANSGAVRQYLVNEGVAASKIEVIYNGLDPERLKPKITNRAEVLSTLKLPGGEKNRFITLVANLRHRVKNQEMFLRSAEKVIRKFPDAHFVLAGEGERKNELEKLAKELGIGENAHFIGRCSQVPELLSVSTIGVLTSLAEGFSNSILEYMAAGLPVVATDVGGAPEAVAGRETGFLVPSDDDRAMADRLLELLEDQAKASGFGQRGRKIVEEKFSLRAQLERTEELYRKVASERK